MVRISFILSIFLFFSLAADQNKSSHVTQKGFVVFSPPKCGTHLIAKTLELITHKKACYQLTELPSTKELLLFLRFLNKDGQFLVAHNFSLPHLQAVVKAGFKVIFIMRDPRDQLVSMSDWMDEGQWNWLEVSKITEIEARITEMITGEAFGWKCYEGCIGNHYSVFRKLPVSRAMSVRFEDLVGPCGGGTAHQQIEAILSLAKHLKFPLSFQEAASISQAIFGGTGTFRHGQIGRWREYFLPYQKDLFNRLYGDVLLKWGYSPD